MAGIQYRPEIDGLRAVAVIPVILFHMEFDWIPGGFVGVDVFFVISGFLITSILRRELESGTFSFRAFWARRIRRILPAMTAVTAATLAVTYCFVFKPDQLDIGRQSLAALLSVANIYFWRTSGDYWGTDAEESPFLHTWSLSVEEQFYVLFPIAIWAVNRFRPRWLQGFIILVIVSSLFIFLWGSVAYPTATFYLLPTRAWELATGCLLAVVAQDRLPKASKADSLSSLAFAGLCLLLGSYLYIPRLDGSLAIPVFGAALVLAFGQGGVCGRLLSQRPLVQLGKMSYSLYLWHWPVLVFAEYFSIGLHKALLFVPIYALSLASYYLVEKPTRRRNGIVPYILGFFLLVVSASLYLAFTPRSYHSSKICRPHWYGRYYDLVPSGELGPAFERLIVNLETPERLAEPDAYLNGGIIVGQGDKQSGSRCARRLPRRHVVEYDSLCR